MSESTAEGLTEAEVHFLAGVRCQMIHQQIGAAWCVNCESWARVVGGPFWRPSFAAIVADRLAASEAERDAALAALDRVKALAEQWEADAGEDSDARRAFGPQVVSVPFAVQQLRAAVEGGRS